MHDMLSIDANIAEARLQVRTLRRWRYYDPFLAADIARSHLMDEGEALGLDPQALALPGSEVVLDGRLAALPRLL